MRPMQMCYFLNIFGPRIPENGRDRQPDKLRRGKHSSSRCFMLRKDKKGLVINILLCCGELAAL